MDDIGLIGVKPWLKFIWRGHITNWLWRDRELRRELRNDEFFKYKARYLDKYIPYIRDLKIRTEVEDPVNPAEEKIFSIWFQGEENAPGIIRACLNSIRRRYPERFKVLNLEDLKEYIKLPGYIEEKFKRGEMGAPHYSDLCRLELLSKYGGYWFDATCLMTGAIPEEISRQDFFMYLTSPVFNRYMFVQNCFIRAKKGDKLLLMWRDLLHEYWKREEHAIHYFFGHRLFQLLVTHNEEARKLFSEMPKITMDPTHVLWGELGEKPFEEAVYEEMRDGAFFQKCNIKRIKGLIREVAPGSMAAVALSKNSGIEDPASFELVDKNKDYRTK